MTIDTSALLHSPWWWEAAPRPELPVEPLPEKVEVAVVGSGYAGLSTALTLARGGREVMVFDAEAAGWGASSRNQGQVGAYFKRSYQELMDLWGREKALAVFREGSQAIAYLKEMIRREEIECHLRETGRLVLAYTKKDYESLAQSGDVLAREVGIESHMVPKGELHREIASDFFQGGQVRPADAQVHPALLHAGMLEAALRHGARMAPMTKVETAVRQEDGSFVVTTPRGTVRAREVVIATNAYTGSTTPELRRRVIPVAAYGIATEPLGEERISRLLRHGRVYNDTRKLIYGFRPAPDEPRIIFGGRPSMTETDARVCVPRLYRRMTEILPDLEGVGLTHAWMGFVAFTFDKMPHIGRHDGMHYALGCCGSGVAMQTWLGHRIAGRILGWNDTATAFDDLPFETRALYTGTPWFLPFIMGWYRFQDMIAR